MKVLGVQIANGYSPEARVFASLLANRGNRYDALVIHQDSDADSASVAAFERDSKTELVRIDTGWRRNDGGATAAAKIETTLRFAGSLGKMLSVARQYEPDVIYSCQQHIDCWAASYLSQKLKKPQIIHLHYTVGYWLKRQPLQRLLTCDQVVAISEFITGEALRHGVDPRRLSTIINSAPVLPTPPADARGAIRKELEVPSDALVIGNVSRIDEGKGHQEIIAAFATIAEKFGSAYLVIVGDGALRAEVERAARELPCSNRIIFTGRRNDVSSLHGAMDVFIHPSHKEPCGLAVMEASVSGLPVVAYLDGATPEIVKNGVSGLLTPPGDINGLASSLSSLLADRALRESLGANGHNWMHAEFQPGSAGAMLAAVFERVVEQAA